MTVKEKEGDGMSSNPGLKFHSQPVIILHSGGKKQNPNKSCNSCKGHKAKGAKLTEQVWERKESVFSNNLWI